MANCKQGDLAIIVRDPFGEDLGRIVKVERPSRDHPLTDWECSVEGAPFAGRHPTSMVKFPNLCEIPDEFLRPIRGDEHPEQIVREKELADERE